MGLANKLCRVASRLAKCHQVLVPAPRAATYATSAPSRRRLSLFICAADEASDQAGAALVAALKQLYGGQLHLSGVGGPLLQAQGLQSVVSEEQQQQLATAEVVQPVYSLHKMYGVNAVSKTAYLKIFRDKLWEAALAGCGSISRARQQQQQGQQLCNPGGTTAAAGVAKQSMTATTAGGAGGGGDAGRFDAVLTISSPLAASQVLEALKAAERARKAQPPLLVHYMVPGLWDYQQSSGAATRWSRLTDHVLCTLPFEPPLLHAAGLPATFVGHPIMQPLLQPGSFSNRANLVSQLLMQRQQEQQQKDAAAAVGTVNSRANTEQRQQQQSLFRRGNARNFWQLYDSLYNKQHMVAAIPSSGSSTGSNGSSGSTKQPPPRSHQQQQQLGSQQQRVLLALLPGTTETEVVSSMAMFDQITRSLRNRHPNLVAAMILPDVLVEAAIAATNNYGLPVLVVPAADKLAADALAAAAAAVSHPGDASLAAVAAGVPLVCVRDGSLLRDGWAQWRSRRRLQYGCVPNLLLGREGVLEVYAWHKGGSEAAVAAVGQLLDAQAAAAAAVPAAKAQTTTAAAAGGGGRAAAEGGAGLLQEQHRALSDVLLALVPPALPGTIPVMDPQQQQEQQQPLPAAAAMAAAVPGKPLVGLRSPAEAAAAVLLELMQLRWQQDLQRWQGQPESSTASPGTGAASSNSSSSSSRRGLAPEPA